MRKVFFLAFLILGVLAFGVKILNPIGPSIIPIVGILEGKFGEDIDVVFWKSVDEVVAHLKKGDVDIAVLPVSMGANLYNRGFRIKLAAVTMWKAFYVIGTESVNSVADLKGKEIYMPHTRGTTVDVMLRYMIASLGMNPDEDVRFVYAPPQEIVSLLKVGKVKLAAPPEPFVTISLKIPGVKILLDIQEEWAKFTGLPPKIPITGVFILESSPNISKALKSLEESLNWALKNPKKACEITTRYLRNFDVETLLGAMERSDYEYYSMDVSSHIRWIVMEYLRSIHSIYPKSMPKVPDEGFFYLK